MQHRWPLHLLINHLHNILSESVPLVVVLVPPSSSMAAVSKAFTLLPRKSDRSGAEVGERCQSHMLRFGKCLGSVEKLRVLDFPLKSSSQKARTVLTRANSFLAFSICTNHQFFVLMTIPACCVFL